jgi:hypothetical protein
MSIKKFFIGMAILLSVSLFVIGCPTDAEVGPQGQTGSKGVATLPGAASPALLEAYFKNADKVFLTAALAADIFTVPQGKTLAVVGNVALANGTVINAIAGTLDVEDGSFTGNNGTIIVSPEKKDAVKAKALNLGFPAYTATVGEDEITEDVVLPSLAIGTGGVAAEDFETFAGATYAVYVVGPVTINGTADISAWKLAPLGGITAQGTLTLGANPVITKITAAGALALTGVSNLDTLDTGAFTVTSADTDIALDKLDSSATGKLSLTGAVTDIEVSGGTGIIEFTGKPAFADYNSSFGNTGLTTFADDVTTAKNITFAGPVNFAKTLTATTASTATFNGAATITGAVTTTAALTIDGDGAVKLDAAPALAENLIVTNTAGVTIVSAAIPAGKKIDATTGKVIFGTSANSVTIENGTLTSNTNGVATVAAAGAITLAYTTSDGASLALADKGSITVAGTGKVTTSGLEISGDGTVVTSTGTSTITAGDTSTATLVTGATADNGIQIGTAEDGVALLTVGTAMTYTFTASADDAAVTIAGAFITAPADDTTGAIITGTTSGKANIVLGTATGGIRIGKGDHGGKFVLTGSGAKIGTFATSSHDDGNLPASAGLTGTEGAAAAKVDLGTSAAGVVTTGATVTAFGASGDGYAEINSGIELVVTG